MEGGFRGRGRLHWCAVVWVWGAPSSQAAQASFHPSYMASVCVCEGMAVAKGLVRCSHLATVHGQGFTGARP